MTRTYPSTVSRTLDPGRLGLSTVIGQHDRRLSDADVNLIQDVQDLKRLNILDNQAPSGCLSMSEFQFRPFDERVFFIPAFDVLFRGEVIHVGGNDSTDLEMNRVELPAPRAWVPGMLHEDARIFVVFLEMWGKALNPETGDGYYVDANGQTYFWPQGCVEAGAPTIFPDNTLDPFQNAYTTLRVQTQWRLRVEPLPALAYDFETLRYGLDPDPLTGATMYGRGSIPSIDPLSDSPFQAMTGISGEPCLWRAGNGEISSGLGTVDGYTYATPVALVFQRNKSTFNISVNPFGCGSTSSSSGLLATKDSGRPDGRYADIVYADDVVDTRLGTSLTGYELDLLAKQGISDVFSGVNAVKIARGETPGNKETALGSRLEYMLGMTPQQMANLHTVGTFDGFMNGFSSDQRTFHTTRVLTLDDRATVGNDPITGAANSHKWGVGDVASIVLDAQSVVPGAAVTEVFVQSFYTAEDGTPAPVALYGGQLRIDGLNTRQITIRVVSDLGKIANQLGKYPLVVTLGVTYPAGTGMDTQRVPYQFLGGTLRDSALGTTCDVYGVSDYEVFSDQLPATTDIDKLRVYNPIYSDLVFGVRVTLSALNTDAAISQGAQQVQYNTFTINRNGIDGGRFTGLYVIAAEDTQGNTLHISHREIVGDTMVVIVDGTLDTTKSTVFTVLCGNTAQVAYNPPVKGITALEEVVLFGTTTEATLQKDSRFVVADISYNGTRTIISGYVTSGKLKGFSGNDQISLIWVQDTAGKYVAYDASVSVFGSLITVVVNGVNLVDGVWFMVAALRPTPPPASSLWMMISYTPYQGEGVAERDYTVVWTPEEAFVTTNGTGAAPVVGLQDVFPFDRQRPIAPSMPSLPSWADSDLKNQALSSEIDGNYAAKRFNNVAHTFLTRLHTNDFITPLQGYRRKKVRLITKAGRRGYSKALPHIGFAIDAPAPKSALGNPLQSTVSAITLYIHNVTGNDANDGFSKTTAKRTLRGALKTLPPVLRHPVAIILVDTGYAYTVKDLGKTDFTQALIGDGTVRSASYYCLADIAFVMQESARITIGRETATGERITIDGGSFTGFGDGPAFAFMVSDSRLILHGISFKGFTTAAIKAIDSDVELLDCELAANLVGVSAEQGCLITMTGGKISLGAENSGIVLADSDLIVDGVALKVTGSGTPGAFFLAERGSNMTLQNHRVTLSPTLEDGITGNHVIARAQINSTVTCNPDWVSNGKCRLDTNSTLVRSITRSPWAGGVIKDDSSIDAPVL